MDNKKATSYKLQGTCLEKQKTGIKVQIASNWKMSISRTTLLLMAFFITVFAKAQDSATKKEVVDMATGMRSNGKIYVVVAVLCIILAGIFIYLINLDKKISKLEKETNSN